MKQKLLMLLVLLVSMTSANAQRSYTFNATALNVDGLPNQEINAIVTSVNLNPDGKNEDGATQLCGILANSGWDIVGFSEDFNFHNYLAAAPASTYYNFGKHSGSITTNLSQAFERAEIDGLGIAVAKRLTFTGDTQSGLQVQWEKEYGGSGLLAIGDNGADNMITKGFRMYTVTFATGIAVDVYVLHMDANTADSDDDYDSNGKDKNIVAREAQLKQLADYIKANHNNRPVIILGDTNCRYTREQLKTGFIDVINADSRLTINDAWVELIWGGKYPTYGAGSMMTDAYGMQKGEVVDKVFYINTTESNLKLKANSYLHDASVTVSDHKPVVVNFTLTDSNGTPVDQELAGPAGEVVLTDGTPTAPTVDLSGKTFYLKNVASGLYLKAARGYGSQASEGVHAMPMTFNKVDNDTYYITHTIPNCYLGDNLYLDNGTRADWDIKEIVRSDGAKKYILYRGTSAIASENTGIGVGFATYNANDTKQHWMLYTDDMIKEELEGTLNGTFYNASTLIPYGRVDTHHADTRKTLWQGGPGFSGWSNNANHAMEKWFPSNSDQRFDVYQDITGLPEGTYTLTAQAFHRDGGHGTSSKTVIPTLYAINGSSNTFTTKVCSINDASAPSTKPNNMHEAGNAFLDGAYNVTLGNVIVGSDGKLRIGVRNTSTAANSNDLWCIFNNFQLLYHGTATGDLKGTDLYKSIKAAADEAIAKVESLNSDEATAAFDISNVAYRYNNNLVSDDGAWELAAIENAVRNAVKAQTSKGADMSLAIVNPSFETGNLTGWTLMQSGWDTGANSGQDATGMDGQYLFNTWAGDTYGCGVIYQDVAGLRNGHYVLEAMVTSWADRKAYIVANNQHVGVATTAGEGVFVDLSLDFLVEDGTARIGAVGGNENGDFYYKQGIFYKTDNFRLKYMGSIGEGRVKIALADAKAKTANLNDAAKEQFNNAVAKHETAVVSGDGKAEEAEIYNALKAAIATQPRTETDMTWLITNPGFETGDWTGWTTAYGWDTRVVYATDGVAPSNGEGQYVVNTWNDFVDALNSGINAPVHQTLTNMPNGRYRLTAFVTSDGGNQVTAYATANEQTATAAVSPENNATFKTSSVEFDVTDGTATIGAVGLRNGEFNAEGGCWYKADNFRLTYLGHNLTLNETGAAGNIDDWYTSVTVTRTMKAGKWNTFVVPFDMEIPAGWVVKKLTNSTMNGDNITLTFSDADAIKAGTPYMVRVAEQVSSIEKENINVTTALNNASTGDIEFVGVYANGYVPEGSFFISGNKFYRAADNTNKMKAFRAYLQPKGGANIKAVGYSFDDVDATFIEGVESAETAVPVAVYGADGALQAGLQKGLNIVKMSDGKVKKVMVK